jgi:hypothetical protein
MEEQQQKQGLGVPAEYSRRAIRSNSSPETGCGISTSIPNADEEEVDEYEGTLIGYMCMCCGHSQARPGWGGQCDRCCGPLDEWID